MKIERINDNQIRCTLTRSDLASRQLKLSELTTGSEKARELFREMMQEAYREYGFETDNIPLMIEAIPASADCLILIVTKVQNPEELDLRFSGLNGLSEDTGSQNLPFDEEDDFDKGDDLFDPLPVGGQAELEMPDISDKKENSFLPTLEQIMGLFNEAVKNTQAESEKKAPAEDGDPSEEKVPVPARIFGFSKMEPVSSLCSMIQSFYTGDSILYRDPACGDYFLVLKRAPDSGTMFDRACRIACDFGTAIPYSPAQEYYFIEHFNIIVGEDAVSVLSSLA